MKKFIFTVLTALCFATPIFAQVSSTGTGTVYAKPDCAHLNFIITTEHVQASKAHLANRDHADAFFALLKKNNIEDRDVSTVHFSINPKWSYSKDEEPKQVGYVVVHALNVKVRDPKNVGSILDVAIGDNVRLQGISFVVSDRAKLESQARDLAVADAKTKANQLIKGLGETLGKVVSVNELVVFRREGAYNPQARTADTIPNATQVAAGEQAITVNVSVVWETAHHHHHHHHKKK